MEELDQTQTNGGTRRIGYARVSTLGQEVRGTSLETQTKRLKQAGCAIVFSESATGTHMERSQLKMAIDYLLPGDTLVVTDLDRLGRDKRGVIDLLDDLEQEGKHFECLAFPDLPGEAMAFLVPILAQVAKMEHTKIMERTARGREAARLKREAEGTTVKPRSPKYGEAKADECARLLGAGFSTREVARMAGISRQTLFNLKERHSGIFSGADRAHGGDA